MKRLRAIRINFAEHGDGASTYGITALLVGAGALMLSIAMLQDILARTALIEDGLGQRGAFARTAEAGAGGTGGSPEKIKRANVVAHEIARRWDTVFLAIEAASDPEVALLAIEPDASKHSLRVTAEARSKEAMLRHIARLQAQQPLQRVLLEQHEVLVQERERPVRFVVTGLWGHAQ